MLHIPEPHSKKIICTPIPEVRSTKEKMMDHGRIKVIRGTGIHPKISKADPALRKADPTHNNN